MKVFVSGSDGLLGSTLVRRLLQKRFDVRALVLPSSQSTTLDGLSVERIEGNILDLARLTESLAGCQAVFHVAASTAMWPPRALSTTQVNLEGTRNMLEAAIRGGVGRFIHVGSASSFGYGTQDNPGDEKTPYRYQKLGLAYFNSKLEAQQLVQRYVRERRIDAVIVNPTFMFGAYNSGHGSAELISTFAKMPLRFYPPGGRCFVHARDVADGMISALERGRTGESYILGNRNMSFKELFAMLRRVVGGTAAPQLPLPAQVLRLLGLAGSSIARFTGRSPEITREIAACACLETYYSSEKARQELDFPRTPIEVALGESYRWLQSRAEIQTPRRFAAVN